MKKYFLFSRLFASLFLFTLGSSCQSQNQNEEVALNPAILFSVNRSSHDVSVINPDSGELIKTVSTGIGPHEISISGDHRYAFVVNYGNYPRSHKEPISPSDLKWISDPQHSFTKIDLSSYSSSTIGISEGSAFHGIAVNQDGSIIWVTEQNKGVVKEVDANSGEVLHEYKTALGSHIIVSDQVRSKLYVSNIDSNSISIIDLNDKGVANLRTPAGPEGLALSKNGEHLWVLCRNANRIAIFDTGSNELIKEIDAEGKFPIKADFINGEVWVSNVASQDIAIFDANSFEFKENLKLRSTPLGLEAGEDRVFITFPRLNQINAYDVKTRQLIKEINIGMEQDGLYYLSSTR